MLLRWAHPHVLWSPRESSQFSPAPRSYRRLPPHLSLRSPFQVKKPRACYHSLGLPTALSDSLARAHFLASTNVPVSASSPPPPRRFVFPSCARTSASSTL